jgi:hypothetical protein
MRSRITTAGWLTIVVVLGCAGPVPSSPEGGSSTPHPVSSSAQPVSPPTPTGVTLTDAAACPVTLPGEPPPDATSDQFFGWSSSYGNGELWVGGLWPDGIIAAKPAFVEPDGTVGMKFGWWREAPGKLTITGRRLDGPGPPARGDVPDGYGERGFQASGVSFPVDGCWEIEGRLPTTTLTFTTFVIKIDDVSP